MPSTVPHYLALVGLVLTASLAVLGQNATDDHCGLQMDCKKCVVTQVNTTEGAGNATCVWEVTGGGQVCEPTFTPGEGVHNVIVSLPGCDALPTSTTPAPTTSTTVSPTTTNSTSTTTVTPTTSTAATTTTVPPTSNGTTTTTTAPTSNGTTTTPAPTPTTSVPTNTTTAAPSPKPAPAHGGFSWASFIGGIVFAAALSSVAYLIWRFYKVRLDRNYHTLSTNLI